MKRIGRRVVIGLRGSMGLIGPRRLMGLMGLMGLCAGCSEDREPGYSRHTTIEVAAYAEPMSEEENEARTMERIGPMGKIRPIGQMGITRTWTPPTGYSSYSALNSEFAQQNDLTGKSIRAFFTQDSKTPLQGKFDYQSATSNWTFSTNHSFTDGTYYVYGFIPSEAISSDAATVTGNSNYGSGAVLTLNGLSAVTPNDVCVIVGAKEGWGVETVTGLATGQFAVEIDASTEHRYLFLLFEHLYAGLRFRFQVDAEYNKLRTIKLKKLEMKACTSDTYETGISSTFNATVTLAKNSTGTSPVSGVTFSDGGSGETDYVTLYDCGDGYPVTLLANDYSSFLGCFTPGSSRRHFLLKSTYDVYDKATPTPNCIRANCTAENKLSLERDLARGDMHTVYITVTPTYLYMLSEPDLDSPTVVIN